MGYDFHITRKENWSDEDGPEISLDEWIHYVRSDPEMRLDGFAEVERGSESTIRITDPSMAVWTSYSGNGDGGNFAWMCLFHGSVQVKNADEEIRRKMWTIAEKMSARLQGDEGEFYGKDGLQIPEYPTAKIELRQPKPWWKFW
jgi:hypothetical protein